MVSCNDIIYDQVTSHDTYTYHPIFMTWPYSTQFTLSNAITFRSIKFDR